MLGTLLDNERVEQAVELGKQLMYTTLAEIEAGAGEYDYSVLGWCLAQMVRRGARGREREIACGVRQCAAAWAGAGRALCSAGAQVWYGRADWAARLCVPLEQEPWYSTQVK